MRPAETIDDDDATAIGLQALVWTLQEPSRADRLIALTGLDPADLRARADEPVVLSALITFLAAHQPDLIACSQDIGLSPEHLIAAGERLAA